VSKNVEGVERVSFVTLPIAVLVYHSFTVCLENIAPQICESAATAKFDSLLCFCVCTDVRRLTTGIRSEKCVVRRFRRCANVIQCTYTNLDSTDMRRLATAIRSEKCVVRRFRRCANVIQCTYTNLDSTDMRRLRRGYVLRNASLGDFVVVRTSYSVLTQTQTVQYSLLHT